MRVEGEGEASRENEDKTRPTGEKRTDLQRVRIGPSGRGRTGRAGKERIGREDLRGGERKGEDGLGGEVGDR